MIESAQTVVIGAGQAGLATSYFLTQGGHKHVVLERGRVGETWRTRWDGFRLNTPNWAQQLPGYAYSGDEPDGFAPLAEVLKYLESYAASFGAPVRDNAGVWRCAAATASTSWRSRESRSGRPPSSWPPGRFNARPGLRWQPRLRRECFSCTRASTGGRISFPKAR